MGAGGGCWGWWAGARGEGERSGGGKGRRGKGPDMSCPPKKKKDIEESNRVETHEKVQEN